MSRGNPALQPQRLDFSSFALNSSVPLEEPQRGAPSHLCASDDTERVVTKAITRADGLGHANSGPPRLVLIEGRNGEGRAGVRTASLMQAARRAAEAADMRVSGWNARAPDRATSYAGARRLLESLGRAGGCSTTDPASVRAFVQHAFEAHVNGPLALLIEDAQWLDEETVRLLSDILDTMRAGNVTLVLGVLSSGRLSPSLSRLAIHPQTRLVRLPASGREDDRTRVAAVSRADTSPDSQSRTFERLELVIDGITSLGPPPGDGHPGSPANVPEAVRRMVQARFCVLSPTALPVARALTVLRDSSDERRLAQLTGLAVDDVDGALTELHEADLVEAGAPSRFAESIVGLSIFHDMPAATQAALHGRAAEVLHADGRSSLLVAAHLLSASPAGLSWRVRLLNRAARRAEWQGDLSLAARCLGRALAEPPAREHRLELLVRLGKLQGRLGQEEATATLFDALDHAEDADDRVQILSELGKVLATLGRHWDAAAVFRKALLETRDRDPALTADLQARCTYLTWLDPDISSGGDIAGASTASTAATVREAFQSVLRGTDANSVRERLSAVADDLVDSTFETADAISVCFAAAALTWVDDLDGSGALLSRLRRKESGGPRTAAFGLVRHREALNHFRRGELPDTIVADEEAVTALGGDWAHYVTAPRAFLARAHLEMGQPERARAVLEQAPAAALLPTTMAAQFLAATGWYAIYENRGDEAIGIFDRVGRLAATGGFDNPAIVAWRTGKALGLHLSGRPQEAAGVADEEVRRARRFGADRPTAVALRTAGIIRGGSEGLELLRESEQLLEGTSLRLDLAWTRAAKARLLRVGGERAAARDTLAAVRAEAAEMQASWLLRQVEEDLKALGAVVHGDRDDGLLAHLTPSERRVAMLAVEGLTNRQIAAQLYVSLKAVEFHLSNVYNKLAISSRRQLPAVLGPQPLANV